MHIINFIHYTIFLLFIVISIAIAFKNKLGTKRCVYALLFLLFALWSLSFVFLGIRDVHPRVLSIAVHCNYLMRLFIGGGVFISILLFTNKTKYLKWFLGGILIYYFYGTFLQLQGYLTYPVYIFDKFGYWHIEINDRLLYSSVILIHTILVVSSFIVLIVFFLKSQSEINRAQSKIIIITGLISYVLSAANIFLVSFYPNIGIPNVPDITMLIVIGGMFYAIYKLGITRIAPEIIINDLIDNMPAGLIITNELDDVVFVNRAFSKFVQKEPSDLLNKPFVKVAEEIELRFIDDKVIDEKNNKITVISDKGEQLVLLMQKVTINKRRFFVGSFRIFTNITQLEIIEQELNRLLRVQEQKLIDKTRDLRQREQYLYAIYQIYDSLLSEGDINYNKVVDVIGKASNSSRTYIFLNHKNHKGEWLMSQVAEYVAPGIKPEIDNGQLQELPYKDFSLRWLEALSSGNIIKGAIRLFPENERQILEPQGIKSILVIPIISGKDFIGFIGFDNCFTEELWSSGEENFLKIVSCSIADKTKLNNIRNHLKNSRDQLQEYSNYLTGVREEERMDISRNLHDDLGQKLSLINITHYRIKQKLANRKLSDEIIELFGNFDTQIKELIQSVRDLSKKIRPRIIDDFGLVVAIEELLNEFESKTGIEVVLNSEVAKIDLDSMRATSVYYIVKEALTNTMRHAEATKVIVEINQNDGQLFLQILDNGIGININESMKKATRGIKIMKERANQINAEFAIKNYTQGTLITLHINNIQRW